MRAAAVSPRAVVALRSPRAALPPLASLAPCAAAPAPDARVILEVKGPCVRPWWRVEAAAPYLLRFCAGRRPFLWVRVDAWWSGADVVRSPQPVDAIVLPPIDAPSVRATTTQPPRSPGWWHAWASYFAHALRGSLRSPLFAGTFRLAPCAMADRARPQRYSSVPGLADDLPAVSALPDGSEPSLLTEEEWLFPSERDAVSPGGVIATRALASDDAGRVRAARKLARDGTLPPVLLAYQHLVGKYVVLDGHVRLRAALDAGVAPPMLALARVRVAPGGEPRPVAHAWPLPGGAACWVREVRAALSVKRGRVPARVVEAVLAGLEE